MVLQTISREFPSQTPMKNYTKLKVFGHGPHFGPKYRQGAPEYQETDSKTKHSELPIFHFSRNSCGKPTYLYMFLVLLESIFVNIVSHIENHSFRSNRKARMRLYFRDFFAPRKTYQKRLRLCRVFACIFGNLALPNPYYLNLLCLHILYTIKKGTSKSTCTSSVSPRPIPKKTPQKPSCIGQNAW